ncbi:hypothetical protein SERLADRAFT_349503 [Serpula lacrymans var. lacrymans S7.9]|uniref:NAD(P)-binding protein n=1 Tax=Serpula lacrymans var. lacrymans (strain S7.9) TaxID=578457 RepID=F8NYS4_SERL9|nr:uncharacterized protein SERLADRAFT_349503 [Serpula lacrymans var. lacrymans S7.9]EGO23745.1 hypothetical protein SERLADRAFT_349503 [Serpula lacrymans var. lacrymans S7.9]
MAYNPIDPANLYSVHGQIAVVTGGGTGIGLLIATSLEHNGATVYIVGRRLDVLQNAARDNNKYGNILPLQGDITSRDSLLSMVETLRTNHGYIDLLVNNAGISRNILPRRFPSPSDPSAHPKDSTHAPSIKAFQSMLWDTADPLGFSETFQTNVSAVYLATVAFLELLHLGNLRLITISSSGSFRLDARVLSVSYTLAKSACTHLGRLLANLLAEWGVRSNVLAPGVWPSEMTATQHFTPSVLAASTPMGRAGTLTDMAGPILFLASRAGAYVNGAVWLVDGGRVGSVASSY